VLWLHKLKVVDELLESSDAIVIAIIGGPEETLEVGKGDFRGVCLCEEDYDAEQ